MARLTEVIDIEPSLSALPMAARVMLMRTSALFAGLTREQCLEIALRGKVRSYERNEFLFKQDEPMQELLLLEAGCVKLTQTGHRGFQVILSMRGCGDALCFHPEMRGNHHTCSARALDRCTLLAWEYSHLKFVEYPEITSNINKLLSSQLLELEERFRELATENAARRLALLLLRLRKQIGISQSDGTRISLSREELAQMTGITLFTVSRILSGWVQTGAIRPRREAVVVLDPILLEALANAN